MTQFKGCNYICGVDEAGRGAWAGPIVAVAVLASKTDIKKWQKDDWFKLVSDSKLLTLKKRELIFEACSKKINWQIGLVDNKTIDEIGIGEANRLVVKLAVQKLTPEPQVVLCDYVGGLKENYLGLPLQNIIDGDAKVFLISLASVLAKVTRDRLMVEYDKKYPDYGFGKHKGYGTTEHHRVLVDKGLCEIHRRSYKPIGLLKSK